MKYLKSFESYSGGPDIAPAPTKTPTKTPQKTPNRPSPLRRDRPSVEPAPKAKDREKQKLKRRYKPSLATAEQVVQRYNDEMSDKSEQK